MLHIMRTMGAAACRLARSLYHGDPNHSQSEHASFTDSHCRTMQFRIDAQVRRLESELRAAWKQRRQAP